MKITILFSLLFLSLNGLAFDAPFGSDGIYFQQRASSYVAFISYVKSDGRHHSFNVVKTIKGKLPKLVRIPVVAHEEAPLPRMKAGQVYLAFLKANRLTSRLGIYQLPMQGMSIRTVPVRMQAKYEEVVKDYVAFAGDKARLSQKLLAHADVADEYLQYSAIRDLTTVFPPSSAIAQNLGKKLQSGKIRSSDAKLDVVEQISRFKLTGFTSVLESMILNSRENVSVRSAGLVSLERMGQVEAIRRVAPTVVNDPSGRLRRIGIDVIKPR